MQILNDVIDRAGGVQPFVSAMAKAGGRPLSRDSVYMWRHKGEIPANWWAPFIDVGAKVGKKISLSQLRRPLEAAE